jgi:hypothetical protein
MPAIPLRRFTRLVAGCLPPGRCSKRPTRTFLPTARSSSSASPPGLEAARSTAPACRPLPGCSPPSGAHSRSSAACSVPGETIPEPQDPGGEAEDLPSFVHRHPYPAGGWASTWAPPGQDCRREARPRITLEHPISTLVFFLETLSSRIAIYLARHHACARRGGAPAPMRTSCASGESRGSQPFRGPGGAGKRRSPSSRPTGTGRETDAPQPNDGRAINTVHCRAGDAARSPAASARDLRSCGADAVLQRWHVATHPTRRAVSRVSPVAPLRPASLIYP